MQVAKDLARSASPDRSTTSTHDDRRHHVAAADSLSTLFSAAFNQSRNAMALLDADRRVVEVNGALLRLLGYTREQLIGQRIYHFVADGPVFSEEQWRRALAAERFTGETEMVRADDSRVAAQWAATTEVVTGRRLALFVALSTSRWGGRFRRSEPPPSRPGGLSIRESEVVRLVASGNTGPEIADELQIAHDTVRTHVRNAMAKTGARSRAHLVAKALGSGLVLDEHKGSV
jgi:PAS domain S-box-containing protein